MKNNKIIKNENLDCDAKDINNTKGKWNYLYKKHVKEDFDNFDEYFRTKIKLKKRFIKSVIKYANDKRPVLECGCGTGKTSVYLASLGIDAYAMDIEKEMVDETIKLSKKMNHANLVKAIHGDIINIPYEDKYFSVTHSSGVLEHYDDEQIVKYINEQIRVSDFCIFSIPTLYFEKKMLGNERFLKRSEWKKIIKKSNAKIVKSSGYHYKTFNKRMLEVIKNPKRLFKPIAMYMFILKGSDD